MTGRAFTQTPETGQRQRPSEADRARRRLRVFAFGIAFLFGALALANWWTSRDQLRAGSGLVSGGGEPPAITDVPTSYRAVYRVENRAAGDLVVQTEKIWVKRPFASRVETFKGPPPGTERQSVRQSALGVLTNVGAGSAEPLNIAVPPSLASGDVRFDPVLEEAVESRDVLRRERREVYGRECQIYRMGGPISAGGLTRYEPGRGTYADVCIDRNGIVLEEYWVDDEKLIRRRVATEVEVDRPIGRDLLAVDAPANTDIKRGAVSRIPIDRSGEGLWTLPSAPEGYERLGRYAVVLPEQAMPSFGGGTPSVAASSTSDVYVNGPDLIVVDQDPSLAALTSFESRPTRDVDLRTLKEGKLIVDARSSEVRGETPDGSVVRIFGTIPSAELIELANKLRPQDNQG